MLPPADQKWVSRDVLSDEVAERRARSARWGAYDLSPAERLWQERYHHLQRHGYLLRPRYSPGWNPSWLGTDLMPISCEDSIMSIVGLI